MNFKPIPYYKGPSYLYKNRRILWLNSSFNSGFTLIDNKVYDVFFDLPPLQIYKNSKLKVLTYIRDSNQTRPIVIKLKDLNFKRNSVMNTDNEYYPVIYSNHTGVEGMTFTNNPSIILIPQQIPRITLRLDDDYNNYLNGIFGTITNGEIFNINNYNKYIIFKSSGSFVLNSNLPCDILVVGGGGGGGYFGGGGGAGQVLYTTGLSLPSGSYTIVVGNGGAGVSSTAGNGNNGQDSSITISGTTYTAKGGGGGGTRQANDVGRDGNAGGCGGGASHTNSGGPYIGGVSNKNTYSGWTSLGFAGGNGKSSLSGNDPNHGHGGGGGAGGVGGNFKIVNGVNIGGGDGGLGVNLSSIFGSSVGHQGWFAGGGGGGNYQNGTRPYGNGGEGLLGGGGAGSVSVTQGNQVDCESGLANTGGGGGGTRYASATVGNGGSGVVIIKYNSIKRIEGITPIDNKPPPFILGLELEDE